MMRILGAILVLVAVSDAFQAPSLRGTYSMTGVADRDSFFKIPRTTEEATSMGWVQPPETLGDKRLKTFCLQDDPRICVLIDAMDSVAGYQISLTAAVKDLNMPGIDYVAKGFKELTLFGKQVLSNQIFFVSQEVIENGGREFNNQTGTGLWLQAGKELTNTPVNEEDMWQTSFKRQNCFMRMGQHWFWAVTKDLKQEDFMPWFTLFDKNTNELVGFGFISFGSKKEVTASDSRPWFENVPVPAIYAIAPDIPKWIADYVNEYGVYSHHVYFIEDPWNISCGVSRPNIDY